MLFWCTTAFLSGCDNPHTLTLRLAPIEDRVIIDTVESFHEGRVLLVNLVHHYGIDQMDMHLAVLCKGMDKEQLVYHFPTFRGLDARVTGRYIAWVKRANGDNWGWYWIQHGQLLDTLPGMRRIVDSMQRAAGSDVLIREENGTITELSNSQVLQEFDYSKFVVTTGAVSVDSLLPGLYQLQAGALVKQSANADDLFKQRSGLYYVPSPGCGLVKKFDKQRLFKLIDSSSLLANPPSSISINAVP